MILFKDVRMKKLLLLVLFALLFAQCRQKKAIHITEFSQKDVNNAVLVDVRTPDEYNEGHLQHAININWFDEDFLQQAKLLNKEKTVYLYCKKGVRSAKAAQLLDSLGYDVVDLLGGYDAHLGAE